MILLEPLQIYTVKKINMDGWEWDGEDDYVLKGSYLFNRTRQLIWKYNADGGPTCWHHLVHSVTEMASEPAVTIHEKLECFKKNGNNLEVRCKVYLKIFPS